MYGLINNGEIVFATDGNSCWDTKTGKCYCAECYHYGADAVNCRNAKISVKDGLVPIKWNKNQQKFVLN